MGNCTQVWAQVLRHGNRSVILKLEGIQRRETKLIKRVNDYSYRERDWRSACWLGQ